MQELLAGSRRELVPRSPALVLPVLDRQAQGQQAADRPVPVQELPVVERDKSAG
jgi:hypothetical protein